ncbi:response regulator transcription factor [Vallitalea okinawensis]|uniref:response regulator transcription factor n=1 Tax=Vallitalea okinawensis TaxID=2078660 RepID=UPI000CFC8063|nr:response regulator transcription factor [Vallitalea okinawensis]
MTSILIVEDDQGLNEGISFMLSKEGYMVLSSYNVADAESKLQHHAIDLIIMDINLPDQTGLAFCKKIRKYSQLPIIFLTAMDTEEDIIKGFQYGGDDYITKPFSLVVLKERVAAVLRRIHASNTSNIYQYMDIQIDFDKVLLLKKGEPIKLTATEFKLIKLLIDHKKKVVTRTNILERLWDIDGNFVDENAVNVNIRRLRTKIEDNPSKPEYIKTVFGIGYTWGEQ